MSDSHSERSSQRLPALLAAVGLLFSILLEVTHVRAYLAPTSDSYCSPSARFDCVQVALSPSSVFLGMPLAIWGIFGFAGLLVLALRRDRNLLPVALFSAAVSALLLVVSLVRIGSLCLLCETVHVTSWLLAVFSFRARRELRPFSLANSFAPMAPLFGALLGAWLFVPHYWAAFTHRSPVPYATGATPDGLPWIGSREPKVTLEEFVDYSCPHCKVSSARSLQALEKHPEIRLVRRFAPRMTCQGGTACANLRLVLCAAKQNRFWQADRYVFAKVEPRRNLDAKEMAEELGLDVPRFVDCFAADETMREAELHSLAARKLRIVDTPTYMVGGKKLRKGKERDLLD